MVESNIFISYSHKDKAEVLKIINALVSKGYSILFDSSFSAGNDWKAKAEDYMIRTQCAIFMLSDNSITSSPIRYEVQVAHERSQNFGYEFFPVLLDNKPLKTKYKEVREKCDSATVKITEDIMKVFHNDIIYIENNEKVIDSIIDSLNKKGIYPQSNGEGHLVDLAEEKTKNYYVPEEFLSSDETKKSRKKKSSKSTSKAKKETTDSNNQKLASINEKAMKNLGAILYPLIIPTLFALILSAFSKGFNWPINGWFQWVISILYGVINGIVIFTLDDKHQKSTTFYRPILRSAFFVIETILHIALGGSFIIFYSFAFAYSLVGVLSYILSSDNKTSLNTLLNTISVLLILVSYILALCL